MDLLKGVKNVAKNAMSLFEDDEEDKKSKSSLNTLNPNSKFNEFFNQTEQLRKTQQSKGTSALGKTSKSTGVGNMRTSRAEKGISSNKIDTKKFAPDMTGRSSSWENLKKSRGIDVDNKTFSGLHANSVRMDDRKKREAINTVANAPIDLARIVSKNADSTFKNTVKSYNASNTSIDLSTLPSVPGMTFNTGVFNKAAKEQQIESFNEATMRHQAAINTKPVAEQIQKEIDTREENSILGRVSKAWDSVQPHDKPITVKSINGEAPKGLKAGDTVVTSKGGTYKILAVFSDGSYLTDAGAAGSYDENQKPVVNSKGEMTVYEKALNSQNSDEYLANGGKFDQVTDRYGNRVPRKQEEASFFEKLVAAKDAIFKDNEDENDRKQSNYDFIHETEIRYLKDPEAERLGSQDVHYTKYVNDKQYHDYLTTDQALMAYATREQQMRYNYLYHKDGPKAAQRYFEALKELQLNKESAAEMNTMIEEDAKEHPISATAYSVLMNSAMQPIAFIGNLAKGAKNKLGIGEYSPIDSNSPFNVAANSGGLARSTVESGINNDLGKFLYSTATSGADMIASSVFFGGLGSKFVTGAMSTSSANAAMMDTLNRGGTQEQAIANGLLNGALEYLSESPAVEGIFKLAGGKRTGISNVKSMAKALFQQIGIEAGGEAVANFSQNLADSIVMGDHSNYELTVRQYIASGVLPEEARKRAFMDFYLWDTLEAAASGALLGGLMGGTATGIGHVRSGGALQSSARNFAADRESSIDAFAKQYESEGISKEEAKERATKEVDDQIENGTYINTHSGIAVDIAQSVKRSSVGEKYKKTADKVLSGEKTGIIELANMKGALQNYNQNKAKESKDEIYQYVGLETAPSRLAGVFGKYTGKDETGFANKKFTEAWIQKSAEILDKASTYQESDIETKRELRKYMDNADTLLYGQMLSDDGNATAYVRAVVNNVLNGVEASAAGSNVISEKNDIYDTSSTVEESSVVPETLPGVEAVSSDAGNVSEPSAAENAASISNTIPVVDTGVSSDLTTTSIPIAENTVQKEMKEPATDTVSSSGTFSGKVQGSTRTYHKSEEKNTVSELVESAKEKAENPVYDIIKVNEMDGTVTFIETDDFDGKPEPKIVSETAVNSDGTISISRPQNKILVDKSEYVSDGYDGFDLEAQRERENTWKNAGIRYNPEELTDKEYFESKFGELLRIGSTDAQTEGEIENGREGERGYQENGRGLGQELGKERNTGRDASPVLESSSGDGIVRDTEQGYIEEATTIKDKIKRIAEKAEKPEEIAISNLVEKFGVQVEFFKYSSGLPWGMFDKDTNTLYVVTQNDVSLGAIAGHELFHYLVKTYQDFRDIRDDLNNLPLPSEKKQLREYCLSYIKNMEENNESAIEFFKKRPEKALEEIMANEFANYLSDTFFQNSKSRFVGLGNLANETISEMFHENIEYLLKQHFPDIYTAGVQESKTEINVPEDLKADSGGLVTGKSISENETETDGSADRTDGSSVQEEPSGDRKEDQRGTDSDSEVGAEKEQSEEVEEEKQEETNVQRHDRELHEGTESESVSDLSKEGNTPDTDTEAERMGDEGVAGGVQTDGRDVPEEQTVSGSNEAARYDDGRSTGDGETAGKGNRERRPGRDDSERRFFINREVDLYKSGSISRANHNIGAIKVLKEIETSGRAVTDEEKQLLAGYTGWGGLSGLFNSHTSQNETLIKLLTKEEYAAAISSSRNAYYTPVEIIDAVYAAVAKLGINANARILEQSCGNGRFFGYMPQELRNTSAISGVELDPISGNIAKLLYDDVNINVENYTKFNQKGFDLIVGNVPFGNERVYDENYRKESNNSTHDYFILKGLEQLSPGGIAAVLTSSSTMDKTVKTNNKGEVIAGARLMMSEKANFIGAVRFPEGVFDSTNVVTDLLIFQKKGEYVDNSLAQKFLNTVDIELKEYGGGKSKKVRINEYFANHPEMVFGTPYLTKNQFGKEVMGVRKDGRDYRTIPDLLPSSVYTEKLRKEADALNKKARETAKNDIETTERRSTGVFNIIDDQIYSFEKGKWRPYTPKKKGVDGKEVVNTDKVKRIKGMHQILEAKRELLDIENSESDDAYVQKKIKEFNDLYDKYVVKYGKLNSRKNADAYGVSPNYGMLQSLEKAKKGKDGKTVYEKEDIFTRRVISPYTEPTSVSNVNDALYASMNLKRSVDLAYMSKLYGKTESEIIEELGDKLYINPFDGKPVLAEEYLSGNVREKLEEAKEAAKSNPEYARNVEALSKVIPADLQPDEIDASLGASWIAPDIIEKFVNHLFKTSRTRVFYNQVSAKWSIDAYADGAARNQWGTGKKTPVELLTYALNNETPDIRTKENVPDEKATEEAKAKIEEIRQAFKDWVWVDKERSDKLVRTYNDTFNNYVERDVDISHVKSFPGQSNRIRLMPHQIKAALKALYQKSALFVHTVGAGKTFAMISAVQEMKRTGVSNKPLLVVPNAKVSDFVKDYNELFPAANLLAVGDDDFNTKNIHSTLAKIEQNDYDCIIMRMSSFDRFPISAEAMEEYKQSELAKYMMFLEAAKAENGAGDTNVKEMQRSIDSYRNKLEQMVSEATDNAYGIEVFLDKCGIDSLFVDEAHGYKNLFFPTRQKVAGISKNEITQKSTHMHMVTELMHKRGNHVTFATATPVTNSLAEFYTMMRYLMPDMLESAGIDNFDAWSSVFGQIETKNEMNMTGQAYKQKTRFSKLKNISDLMRMLRQVFDFVSADDIVLATPAARINHIKSPSSTLLYYINQRIDAEDALKDKKGNHNAVANYTLAKMVSLDLRLARKVLIDLGILSPDVTNEQLDLPDSKVNKAVNRIMMNYDKSSDIKGTQIVFLDTGVPKKFKKAKKYDDEEAYKDKVYDFDLYSDIKTKLIQRGIPEEEVAFIHDFDTDIKKQMLSDKMNDGEIRVLIGSTEKAGTGINVQKRIVALHHLDAPQKPADLTQRNGRGVRQKNMNDEIEINYYSTMNSYDAPKWEMLNRKSTGIESVMKGDPNIREIDDSSLDDTFSGLSVAAANNPVLFELQDIKEKIKKLEAQRSNHMRRINLNQNIIENYPSRKKAVENSIRSHENAKRAVDENTDGSMKGGRKTYEKSRDASRAAYEFFDSSGQKKFENQVIGKIDGVNILARQTWESATQNYFLVSLDGIPWVKEMPVSFLDAKGKKAGNKGISALNMFDALRSELNDGYDSSIQTLQKRLYDLESEYQSARNDDIGTFKGEEELNTLRNRQSELEKIMLDSANDNAHTFDLEKIKNGDFNERIDTDEALEEQIGYIESGKEKGDKRESAAGEIAADKIPVKKSSSEIQYARQPKTAKERAQETARNVVNTAKSKMQSTNVIDESVPHTAEEQKIIDEYKAAVNPELLKFIEDIQNMKDRSMISKRKIILSELSKREVRILNALTDVDTTGFARSLDGSTINHIQKRHGNDGNADHSMANINDIARVEYVMENFDDIVVIGVEDFDGRRNRYKDADGSISEMVLYAKKVDSNYIVCALVPDTKAKKMQIHSIYASKLPLKDIIKEEAPQETNAEALIFTPETSLASASSTNNIPQSEENTQGNDGEQYARKKANKQKSDKQTERETPLRGNINSQETTENYGKTAEAREKIKRSEREAGKDIQSIINEIGKTFKINIFSKRYRKGKGVLGFYDKNHQIIHSQNAQQLGVVVHELGHHLDNIYSLEYDDAIKDILSNAPSLRQSLEDAGYSADEMPAEVFADFIWHYLTMPDSAYEMGSYAKGENFYDTFERSLSKEDLKKLQHIRSMLLSFSETDAVERVANTITTQKEADQQNKGNFDSKFDSFMASMVDSTYKADKIDKEIEKAIGRKLSPSESLQLAAEYAGSASNMAYTLIEEAYMDPNGNVIESVDSFKKILKDLDKKVTKQINKKNAITDTWSDDFNVFLKARHGIDWERQQKKTISSDLSGDYQGETEHVSNIKLYEDVLAQLRVKYGNLFDEAADRLYAWNDRFMRDWAVGTGLMTSELYEDLHKRYPHYVPMFRADPTTRTSSSSGKGGSVQNPIKRASKQGSQKKTYPAIDNLITQINNIIGAHYTNQIGHNIDRMWNSEDKDIRNIIGQYVAKIDVPMKRHAVDLSGAKEKIAENIYAMNFARLSEREKAEIELLEGDDRQRKIEELSGMKMLDAIVSDNFIQFRPDYYGFGKNTVIYRKGDKIVAYEILDDSLAQMMRGLEPVQMPKVMELVGKLTRAFSAVVTGQNPVFALRNLVADTQHGYVFTKGRKFDPLNISYVPELFAAWGEAFLNEFGVRKTENYTKFKAGTGYGTQYAGQYDLTKRMLGSDSRKLNPISLLKLLFRGIVHFNDTNESAARYLAYKRATKQTAGSSKDKWIAGWKAGREVTTNFHKRGASSVTRSATRFIPFWNASVSGLDQLRKLIASKETYTTAEGRLRLARALASQTLFGIIRALSFAGFVAIPFIGFGDDDDKAREEYDEFNSYMKYGYWLFHSEKYGWIRVNKDRELSAIFGSLAEFAVTAALNPEYRTKEQIEEFADYMIPLLTIAHDLTGSPIGQAFNNRTWYGGNIVKQSEEDKMYPDYYQYVYDDDTSILAKGLAKGISFLPDNIQEKLGYLSTPKALDYVMEQMTGIIGDVVLPMFKPNTGAAGVAAGIKNQFTANSKRSNRYTSEMYDILDMLTAKDATDQITEEEEKWLKIFNNTVSASRSDDPKTKTIGDYFKDIAAYSSDSNLSSEEKEQKINTAYEKIAAMSKNIVKSFNSGAAPSGTFAEVIIPDDLSSVEISKSVYEKVAGKILSGGSEEEKYYNLIKESSIDEDQKTYIAKKLIRKDANYASIKDKYEPLINAGISVDTLEEVSEATSDYSGIAKTLTIFAGEYGDNAEQNAILAKSLGGIANSTFKKAQKAYRNGVTADMYKRLREAYDSVAPGDGRTERALDAIGATGTVREVLKALL